jgi:hypothetical protein
MEKEEDEPLNVTKGWLFRGAVFAVILLTLVSGCSKKKNDAISEAEKTEKSRPGFEETGAIIGEGFIYGLPIVMNYAVMYEFAVDRNSGQYKAPFNQIHNDHRVFTYKDTAVVTPNSDTPYSLVWLDLRAEPIVLSVPAVEKNRYYSVQLCDGNTFNYGYIGSRSTGPPPTTRAITWSSDRTGRGRPLPASRRCLRPPPSSPSQFTAPSSSIRRICRTWRRSRPATRYSRSRPT